MKDRRTFNVIHYLASLVARSKLQGISFGPIGIASFTVHDCTVCERLQNRPLDPHRMWSQRFSPVVVMKARNRGLVRGSVLVHKRALVRSIVLARSTLLDAPPKLVTALALLPRTVVLFCTYSPCRYLPT